ncbi:MAG: hypothetical protein AB1896_05055 [Thermodesulfobacteriota bacterium]
MEVQPDFKELLELLNAHQVDYLIVGGYALAFHGAPRLTGDLDLFVPPDPENAGRLLAALAGFGFGAAGLKPEDFQAPDQVVQLGFPPVRVDFLTSLTGVSWGEALAGRAGGRYGNVPVFYIGRGQLIANKRALGRPRDLADLEALGET